MKKVSITDVKAVLEEQGVRMVKNRYAVPAQPFLELLLRIEPNSLAMKYVDFYQSHPAFADVPAGARHHHWWKNGLEQHVKEMIGLGFDLLELYPGDLTGKISRSDIIICCFLHDFAKIWTYREITEEERQKAPDKFMSGQVFTYNKHHALVDDETRTLLELGRHGITPTDKQWSGVLFCEGGYSDANFGYHGTTALGDTVTALNPLVPFMHILDMYSSQVLGKSLFADGSRDEKQAAVETAAVQVEG